MSNTIELNNVITLINGYGTALKYNGISGFEKYSNNIECSIMTNERFPNLYFLEFHKPYSITQSNDNYLDALIVKSKEAIDLTNFTELIVQGCENNDYSDGGLTAGAYVTLDTPNLPQSNAAYDWTGWIECVRTDKQNYFWEKHIDISNINGLHYIYFGTYHGTEQKYYTSITRICKISLVANDLHIDKLAGTDAVAIAYAIARNQESAAALQEMKKAYREGVKRGNDGVTQDDNYVDEVIDDSGSTPIEPLVDPNKPDDIDKRGADVYYTIQSGSGETATTYYLRIYTTDETGERGNDTGMYKYAWTYTLVYDLYDSNGQSVIDKQPISTRYSAGVAPLNAWYFKPSYVNYRYEDTSYNIYMYVEKVECSGQYITVHFVTVHAKTGEVYHGRNTTTVGVPEGATVVHTNSAKPF